MKIEQFAALALAMTLGLPPLALAEQDEDFATAEDTPEPRASADAERIVITATRTPMPIGRVGSAITVIDAANIEEHQDTLVVDALERVPGITVRRSGGPGTVPSVFMRGANSNQTLLLVDGIKFQDAAGPNRETQLDHLAVEDIERIEVLRGPQSVLYGSDAIGGVINIITKRARGGARIHASGEFGAYHTKLGTASVRGGAEDYYYGASVVLEDTAGYSIATTDAAGDKDGYERVAFSNQIGLGDERMGIDANFRYSNTNSELDAGASPATSETDSEQFAGRIAPRLSLFDGLWEQTLAYSGNQATRDTVAFGRSHYVGTIQEVDWQHTLRPIERATVVLGGEWEREELESAAPGFTPALVFNHFTADAYAGYADLQITPWDRLDLTGGFRVYHHEDFGTKVVGRGSAALHLEEIGVKLRGSVGSGFKAPTLAQLFDTTFFSNNPNLEAEESFGYDVAAQWRGFQDRLGFEVGYFDNDIDNLIVGAAPTFVNANVAHADTRGVELSFDARVLEAGSGFGDLKLSGNYTWLDTAGTFGDRLLRRPNHEAYFSATWSPHERFDLTTSVRWVSARVDIGPVSFLPVKANDYAVVDLMGRFEAIEGVELYMRIDNIADEKYQDVAGFRQAGISAFFGARIDFDLADIPLPLP